MNKLNRIEIEHDCQALIQAFSYHLDQRNYEALAALFAAQGTWIRHGSRHEGRAQIVGIMQQRPPNQFTRHLTTSTHFIEVSETSVRAMSYNQSYFTLTPLSELPMRYQPDNMMLLDFSDTFIKTADGWRFLERVSTEIMVSDDVRAMLAAHH
jgi:hypothetical protein